MEFFGIEDTYGHIFEHLAEIDSRPKNMFIDMPTDSGKTKYDAELLVFKNPRNSLKIIFEVEARTYETDKVAAVPGSAFVIDFNQRPPLIPWRDYPLEVPLSQCEVVPYNIKELYDKMGSV